MEGVSDNGALARALYDMETAPSAVRVMLEEGPLPATVAIVLRKRVRVKENIDRRLTNLPYATTSQSNVGKVRRMQQSNFAFGHKYLKYLSQSLLNTIWDSTVPGTRSSSHVCTSAHFRLAT